MQIEINSNIGELVRSSEQNFTSGTTTMSKYVTENIYEDISKIDAYLSSRHISGEKDSLDRTKPFFNIVVAKRNIWFRATDIDRRNIKIGATKRSDLVTSFLANAKLQDWMKKANFGQFLNDWGIGLAGYGSYISKFVESDGNLYAMTIPWQRIICDSVDFENNPKIEILELTPSQLRKRKGYDKDMVESLITSQLEARELTDGQRKDNKDDYIKLYEVHGELPLSWLTEKEEDENEYVQQMQVVSFVADKEGVYNDYALYKGREEKDPYMITHLLKKDGYTLSDGSVKSLFQAQWMMNHTIKSIKDQLDLASKLIFQTSDGNYIGQNALNAIENGQILIHKQNEPLTQLANNSHDITSLQAYGNQWQVLAQEITSTPDVMMGNNMPSGTAYRQAAIIQQESYSNFAVMTENKGLALEQMLREYIIPFIKKQLDTTDEIVATLDTYGIDKIDEIYLRNEPIKRTNQRFIDEVIKRGEKPLNPDMPIREDQMAMMQEEQANVSNDLISMGEKRYIKPSEEPDKTWKDIFKDFEWTAEVEITNENKDKQTVMTTLSNVLNTMANPAFAQLIQTPQGKMVFNKILSETGSVSELELSTLKNMPSAPVGGMVAQA